MPVLHPPESKADAVPVRDGHLYKQHRHPDHAQHGAGIPGGPQLQLLRQAVHVG